MNKDKVINELLIKIAKLEYEVERLDKELEIEKDISDGMLETIEKAIEYIEENSDDMHTYISQAITQILKGSEKE